MLPFLSRLLVLGLWAASAGAIAAASSSSSGSRSEISGQDWVALNPGWRGPHTPPPLRPARKSDAQLGALRTEEADEPEELPSPRSPRARRDASSAAAAAAMAQQDGPPFGFNASDPLEEEVEEEVQEEEELPDLTPPPFSVNTRRKGVRNPFYPLGAEAYAAYAVLTAAAIIFSLGILGNVSLMCIVCHNYHMRSISNSLLANLALWDFTVIFFCLPLVVFHQLTKHWLLGQASCTIIPYLEVASLGVTTFTLCALCIDRFRAAATDVLAPYETTEGWASTAAKLAVIWVGALLLALPELLIRQLASEEGDAPEAPPCQRCELRVSTQLPDALYVLGLTYDGARLWWYFGCYFCLPTLFTICSSLATARRIRRAERACSAGGAGAPGGRSRKQLRLESQMNCAVVALAILYGFCMVPENICNIVAVYMAASVSRRTLDVLRLLGQLLLFCRAAATPPLLFGLCRPFRRAAIDCCCCCWQECEDPPAADTPTDAHNGPNGHDHSHGRRRPSQGESAATELELPPLRRAPSSTVGTHC